MNAGIERAIWVSILTFKSIQIGLTISCFGLLSYLLTSRLSMYARITEPDPTLIKRIFTEFFDRIFDPVGSKAADKSQSRLAKEVSYQLGVGGVVILLSTVAYIAAAWIFIGAVALSQQAAIISFDGVSAFYSLIGFVIVCSIAIMSHAGERSKYPQQ